MLKEITNLVMGKPQLTFLRLPFDSIRTRVTGLKDNPVVNNTLKEVLFHPGTCTGFCETTLTSGVMPTLNIFVSNGKNVLVL